MDFTIWTAAGLLGAALYLTAYGALQLGFLRGSSVAYTVLNLAAASFVLLSLVEAFNVSSLLIQVFWIALSIIGLARMAWARNRMRFTDEERAFLGTHFASLPPHLARRFLGLGQWQAVSPGTILTRQGTPVHELVYIAGGSADVQAHGAYVARLGPGALIGELTVMHGSDATADVEITEESRIFTLPRAALLRELQSDHDFALAVANALQIEAQRKIDLANRARASDPPGAGPAGMAQTVTAPSIGTE